MNFKMLDKTKTYLVLNYDKSPICITTRTYGETIPPGNDLSPAVLPLTIDEIIYINTTTNVFKIGKLFFEKEYEEEIYEELRIHNWKDILRNEDIYDIILNPTVDKLERILEIDNQMYFDRVYSAYIGFRNDGVNISSNVENVIKARHKELKNHKRKTEIKVKPKEIEKPVVDDNRVADLEAQLAEMKAMMAQMMQVQNQPKVETVTSGYISDDNSIPETVTTTTATTTKPKTTRSKSSSSKKITGSKTATKKSSEPSATNE